MPPNGLQTLEKPAPMRDLAAARQRFLQYGEIDASVRPVVRDAWLRSRDYEVHPQRVRHQAPDPALAEHAAGTSLCLIQAAQPYLDLVHQTLGEEPHIVALSDRDGRILRLLDDPDTRRTAPETNLVQGASWHERDLGCNGIGTALATGSPVVLIGSEHYHEAYVGWTCLGVPLRGPDGSILGALDLSVPNDHVDIRVWGWTLSMARAVEDALANRDDEIGPVTLQELDTLDDPLGSARGVLDLLALQLPLSPTHLGLIDQARQQVVAAEEGLKEALRQVLESRTALERENQSKDQLLATLSHELRGPERDPVQPGAPPGQAGGP
jgi:transcriptional regulator of acetoin/glycerol metabolism